MRTRNRTVSAADSAKSLLLGLLIAVAGNPLARAASSALTGLDRRLTLASATVNFKREIASPETRRVAHWVLTSDDNHGLPFVIVDKKNARVFAFHANGQLRGAAAALLGSAIGDDSVAGIGERELSGISPDERTTPAGRFVASLDRNLRGREILWVDYAAAISLHPVIVGKPGERRAQRLATPTALDNRISYGCINVPAAFFRNVIHKAFTGTNGVVYVLPETRSPETVFALH